MKLYDRLTAARREAADLERQIAACHHHWENGAVVPTNVPTTSGWDFWAGPVPGRPAIALVQSRECSVCGLRQRSAQRDLSIPREWEDVP